MTAQAPQNGAPVRAGGAQGFQHRSQGIGTQDMRQGIDPAAHAAAGLIGPGEILDADLSAASVNGNRLQPCEIERPLSVLAHATLQFLRTFSRACAVWLFLTRRICSGVPAATTCPPFSPPSGPMSMIQSADLMTSS